MIQSGTAAFLPKQAFEPYGRTRPRWSPVAVAEINALAQIDRLAHSAASLARRQCCCRSQNGDRVRISVGDPGDCLHLDVIS
jgi:hypothetical protein